MFISPFLDAPVLNGGWHKLELLLALSQLSIKIDGRSTFLANSGLPTSFGRHIYFGQSPNTFTAILVGTILSYQGCVRNITIDKSKLSMKDAKRSSFLTPLPAPGCTADKCVNGNSCSGHGHCVANNSGEFCNCVTGFTGALCQHCK